MPKTYFHRFLTQFSCSCLLYMFAYRNHNCSCSSSLRVLLCSRYTIPIIFFRYLIAHSLPCFLFHSSFGQSYNVKFLQIIPRFLTLICQSCNVPKAYLYLSISLLHLPSSSWSSLASFSSSKSLFLQLVSSLSFHQYHSCFKYIFLYPTLLPCHRPFLSLLSLCLSAFSEFLSPLLLNHLLLFLSSTIPFSKFLFFAITSFFCSQLSSSAILHFFFPFVLISLTFFILTLISRVSSIYFSMSFSFPRSSPL